VPNDSMANTQNVGESKNGYRRILLKLSGEALAGSQGDSKFGIDAQTLNNVCKEIAAVIESGTQVAIVVGGGNFFRGISASESGIERLKSRQSGDFRRWYRQPIFYYRYSR